MLGLLYSDYYLPEEYVTFDKILEADDKFVLPDSYASYQAYYDSYKMESGLDKITVGQKEAGIEVFDKIIGSFFEKTDVKPADIAGVFYTDPIPFNSVVNDIVSIPHYLIEKYKMENTTVGIVQQQCTGFVLSIALANSLLKSGQCLLILSSNFIPKLNNRNMNFTFMGDGAGFAAITKDQGEWEIVDFLTCTSGRNTYKKYHNEPFEIEKMTKINKGVELINKILSRNNITAKDLYALIPQNINQFAYSNVYARLIGIKKEKMFLSNLSYGGHIGDVDLIRNFSDFEKNNNIPDKSFVLLYGLGSNGLDMSYGTVLLKYNKAYRG